MALISALINRMEEADQILILKDKLTPMPFSNPKCRFLDVDLQVSKVA